MPFRVDIVAPEGTVWAGEADFLVARTVEGEIGILAGHEPTMAALATGAAKVESGGATITFGIHGGFLQVGGDQVTLLTDRADIAEGDMDAARRLAGALQEEEEAATA